MKKINKILLSICMFFVISFSLVSCSLPFGDTSNNNNNNNSGSGGNPTQTYTPPAGVDMTKAEAYAKWLKDNIDFTLSYEAEALASSNNSTVQSVTIKNQYKDNVNHLASYNADGTIEFYMELSMLLDKVKQREYDLDNFTYSDHIYEGRDVGLYTPYGHICFFLEYPEYQFTTGLPETTVITRTIENKSTGKYVLTNKITYKSGSDKTETSTIIVKLVVENNRVTGFEFSESSTLPNSNKITRVYSYTYKNDVVVNFDTSNFVNESLGDYNEPTGVDMTSADAYANYLHENADITTSYKVTMVQSTESGVITTSTIKYNYKNGVSCTAVYDENNQITSYYEFEVDGNNVIVRNYNLTSQTYTETTRANDYSFFISRLNMMFYADTQAFVFLNVPETNWNFVIPEGVTITKSIEKTAYATYVLTKKLELDNEEGKGAAEYKFTYQKDKIIKTELISHVENDAEENGTLTISFDYEDYAINFDKSNYTKA